MFQSIRSCSFTGHRPRSFSFGYDENSEEYHELIKKIRNTIVQVCNEGCRIFYCGMAEGVDLWCAQIVLEMKNQFFPPLELRAVVPFLGQSEGMKPINQRRYRCVMEAAQERYLVSRKYTKLCFQKRNRFLVEKADALIAVFDPSLDRSGTAQTVRYARVKKKKIFLVPICKK